MPADWNAFAATDPSHSSVLELSGCSKETASQSCTLFHVCVFFFFFAALDVL